MRPISRQSTRLANCRRVCRGDPPRRQFRTSLHQSSDHRPPTSPSSSIQHEQDEQSRQAEERVPVNQSQSASTNHGPVKEPGRGQYRRSSFRTPVHHTRTPEVPTPPPIPEWFLRDNVRLIEDHPGQQIAENEGQTLYCLDTRTKQTLFTIPHYTAEDIEATEAESYGKKSAAEQERLDILAGRREPTRKTPLPPVTSAKESTTKPAEDSAPSVKETVEKHVFDPTYQEERVSPPKKSKDERTAELRARIDELRGFKSLPVAGVIDCGRDPLRWAFLEAEASVRAALAVPGGSKGTSSVASTRVDISLQSSGKKSDEAMDDFVKGLARSVRADIIRLDANDFSELTTDYIGQGLGQSGSYANLSYDVYDSYRSMNVGIRRRALNSPRDEDEEWDDKEEEEDEEEDDVEKEPWSKTSGAVDGTLSDLAHMFGGMFGAQVSVVKDFQPTVVGIGSPRRVFVPKPGANTRDGKMAQESHRDNARLSALLTQLLHAPRDRQPSAQPPRDNDLFLMDNAKIKEDHPMGWLHARRLHPRNWLRDTAQIIAGYLQASGPVLAVRRWQLRGNASVPSTSQTAATDQRKTIVHVRDLVNLCSLRRGSEIISCLVKEVRRRRNNGEQIVIVGTSIQDVPGPVHLPGEPQEDMQFRAITVPPFFLESKHSSELFQSGFREPSSDLIDLFENLRVSKEFNINMRHIQSMVRQLQPENDVDFFDKSNDGQLNLRGMKRLSKSVLPFDQVQRLVLTALGLSQFQAKADTLSGLHISLANFVNSRSDLMAENFTRHKSTMEKLRRRVEKREKAEKDKIKSNNGVDRVDRIERLKSSCNPHETRLLSGVVDPHNIKVGFRDVHASSDTIEALRTLTSLSLLRPDAFKYGVLANDRLSGLLLYGPPGTGKTLLAKAVAKESKATVMEVSGAQIYEKYVGEGEKMVRAVFSLAKKLSPCVVFLDEADAIFSSRGNAGNRNTHREIINQFLREWDGMDDHGVFVMVASNRPFDLDDAVLRRLPRRILVDLPTAADRESILGIHLKNENLDQTVSTAKLAEQTPLYSGSDLKNMAVAAALAAVREENAKAQKNPDFQLPEKRTLSSRHFERALSEISASISEDMGTLSAIRKFDEQYGDGRGRKKRAGYGFGAADAAVAERAARIR